MIGAMVETGSCEPEKQAYGAAWQPRLWAGCIQAEECQVEVREVPAVRRQEEEKEEKEEAE